jgi:hypothetical protein
MIISSDYGGKVITGGKAMPGTTPPRNAIDSWAAADLTAIVANNPPAPPVAHFSTAYLTRTPFGYVTPDGAARVVYEDGSLDIIELRLTSDAGSWQQDSLTVATQAPPPTSAPFGYVTPDGAARVVYPDSDGDIIELYLTSDAASWQQLDLTGLTQAPPAGGAPSAYVTPDGLARVVYPDSNGDVIELRLQSEG